MVWHRPLWAEPFVCVSWKNKVPTPWTTTICRVSCIALWLRNSHKKKFSYCSCKLLVSVGVSFFCSLFLSSYFNLFIDICRKRNKPWVGIRVHVRRYTMATNRPLDFLLRQWDRPLFHFSIFLPFFFHHHPMGKNAHTHTITQQSRTSWKVFFVVVSPISASFVRFIFP